MTVDASIGVMYDRVLSRERDARGAFYPGAVAENPDVAASFDGARAVSDPLSVALPSQAYAIVLDPNGQRSYTRDGAFAIRDGALVDAAGNAVEGYASAQSPLAPLRLNAIDVQLERVINVRIDSDGRLTYGRTVIDPRSGEKSEQRILAGRIALARFPAGSPVQPLDPIHVLPPAATAPHVGIPGDGNFGQLTLQRLTKSHIDVDASLIKLQESYIAFDALRAVKQAHAGTQKTAIDLIK